VWCKEYYLDVGVVGGAEEYARMVAITVTCSVNRGIVSGY
jgi:hypothetical protein